MNTTEIGLVQSSFATIAPASRAVAELFYKRLFELDPSLKRLFKSDMTEQGDKLMSMLRAVVNGLGNLQALVPVAQALAKRHVAYGVEAAYYSTVGAALLDTLDKGLGEAFTPDVRAAWTKAYTTLANVMVEAAYPSPAAE
jgi:nitric oxide dioxygenase